MASGFRKHGVWVSKLRFSDRNGGVSSAPPHVAEWQTADKSMSSRRAFALRAPMRLSFSVFGHSRVARRNCRVGRQSRHLTCLKPADIARRWRSLLSPKDGTAHKLHPALFPFPFNGEWKSAIAFSHATSRNELSC